MEIKRLINFQFDDICSLVVDEDYQKFVLEFSEFSDLKPLTNLTTYG
jgi:hypothetical protein